MTAAARRRTLAVIGTDLAQQWATRINRHGGDAVAAVLAMGADLIAAKKQLQHGGWERMFAGHRESVSEPLRFSVSTAKRLMLIAAHPVLTNRAHVHALPSSWGTLYELTKVDKKILTAALAEGRITPSMERRHVRTLDPRVDLPLRRRTPARVKPDLAARSLPAEGIGRLMDCQQLIAAAMAWCWEQLTPDERPTFLDNADAILQTYRQRSP